MQQDCPNSSDRRHFFKFSVGSGIKSDFEPVEYGKSAADTLYKRVEYSYLSCACGATKKTKVIPEDL